MNTSTAAIHQLEEVFATFNKVSNELSDRYRDLEGRVTVLNDELSATRSARMQELAAKEKLASKLSALMQALPGGVIALDGQGIVREENHTAVQILGKSRIGIHWADVLKETAGTGELLNGEISLFDGKRVSITSSTYNDSDTIILLTDVTENFQLNNLVNREKRLTALGEMSARLAHQIRTPLSSAILYLSHLTRETVSEKGSRTVGKINGRLCQIEKMIESMLVWIRDGMVEAKTFSLHATLKDIHEAMQQQVGQKQGRLKIMLPERECHLFGNQEAVSNAVMNLVDNALQACDKRPEIVIRLNHYNGWFDISVTDNGPGIDEAIKEQIFDPFFSTRTGGTGLGLAVVSSAVKAHDGEIIVRNGEHGGTSFHLLIPEQGKREAPARGIWNHNPEPCTPANGRRRQQPSQEMKHEQIRAKEQEHHHE